MPYLMSIPAGSPLPSISTSISSVATQTATQSISSLTSSSWSWSWLGGVFKNSWMLLLIVFETIFGWLSHLGPPLAKTFDMLSDIVTYVQTHPQPFHILGWMIFFGPIILLIPSLIALELIILGRLLSANLMHGYLGVPLEHRFASLQDHFTDTRESLYATIEHWTAQLNKWTQAHSALVLLRLGAGIMSLWIFWGMWSENVKMGS